MVYDDFLYIIMCLLTYLNVFMEYSLSLLVHKNRYVIYLPGPTPLIPLYIHIIH